MSEFNHISVLLNECIDGLNIKKDGIYVDGTMGGAGHSFAISSHLSDKGRLIGFDQDQVALETSKERMAQFDNVAFVHSNFMNMKSGLASLGIEKVDGILLDLGVSSYQIDTSERGFSYVHDGPLDMRMDQSQGLKAADVVNGYSKEKLEKIFKTYGEERFSKLIAGKIVERRAKKPFETTGDLSEFIAQVMPAKAKRQGSHPAKKIFQAIRIEINQELKVIEEGIETFINLLNPGGRLCIITFHSLEDRIVKNEFKRIANPCICPKDFPVCNCGKVSKGKVVSNKPILPSKEELANNKRSQSAKLRIFERV